MRWTIVAIGLAFGAGLLLGRITAIGPPRDAAALGDARAARGAPGASPSARLPALSRAAPEAADCAEVARDAEVQCALRVAAAGGVEPLPWPDEVPAGIDRRSVEAMVDEILARCPRFRDALIEVDCDEYPCAAYFRASTQGMTECLTTMPPVWLTSFAMDQNGELSALWFAPAGEENASYEMERRRDIRFAQAKELGLPTDPQ